jgi:hypothetical protein
MSIIVAEKLRIRSAAKETRANAVKKVVHICAFPVTLGCVLCGRMKTERLNILYMEA